MPARAQRDAALLNDLVAEEMLRSAVAQAHVDTVLGDVLPELKAQFGYRVLYVTRGRKDISRVRDKVHEHVRRRPGVARAESVRSATSDLAGGRMLVIGHDHIHTAFRFVKLYIELNQKTWGLGAYGDYVKEPKGKTRGWRAVVQDVKVPVDGVPAQFQLQFMTYLQHAWDQLDHGFYEQARSGRTIPDEAKKSLRELSDKLYTRDCEMETIRNCLWRLVEPRRKRRQRATP